VHVALQIKSGKGLLLPNWKKTEISRRIKDSGYLREFDHSEA